MKLMTSNTISSGKGVSFIYSTALLDDLDYYGNEDEDFGVRGGGSFYKGICYKCPRDLKKYSSVERAVIYGMDMGEIVFREPINLKKYLQKILIPNNPMGREMKKNKKIPKYYRDMMTYELDKGVYYRKGCKGKMKPLKKSAKILTKYMEISPEDIPTDLIPHEDIIEIVKRNKVSLIKGQRITLKEIPFI